MRVGIATGLVVVGDLIGEGPSREFALVGDAPNLAARLQQLAKPNQILVAPSTRRLLGDLFEFEDLGERTKLTQTMRFETTEERDTTMQYGVEDGAKQGFARIDAVLAKIAA